MAVFDDITAVMDREQELDVRAGSNAQLIVEPKDILFEDVTDDSVLIHVTVRNESEFPSRPTFMRLESAPLGAFVPWRPLALVPVPSLQPGESRELTANATRPHPVPLDGFDRVPPKNVLTAVGSPDESSPQTNRWTAIVALLAKRGNRTGLGSGLAPLAPDLMELVGRGQPYWAGNLNIFIGSKAVERHLARALRIYPGRTNLAMFMVGGGGKRDAYSFNVVGLSASWETTLYDVTNAQTLLIDSSSAPIDEKQWVESAGGLMIMLAVHPPADCGEGALEVHVTRRSSQKAAVVEFDLDPSAQGSGCYVV